MSVTDSVANLEIAAIAVEDGGNGNGIDVEVVDDGFEDNGDRRRGRHRRRRRGCPDRRRRRRNTPFNGLVFTAGDPSSEYLTADVGSPEVWWSCDGGCRRPEEVDLESGEVEVAKKNKVCNSLGNDESVKRCRICHLNFEHGDDDGDGDGGDGDDDGDDDDRGYAMELGCDCKGDLGTAHQKCAVTWFLMKGNLNCEICGAIAQNLCFQPTEEVNYDDTARVQTPEPEPVLEHELESGRLTEPESESEGSVYSRWFVNGVLTCMVLAFVISWLVHYNHLH